MKYFDFIPVRYADGRMDEVDAHMIRVWWNEEWRECIVQESAGDILCGMKLLENHSVSFDVRPGGEVTIEPFE